MATPAPEASAEVTLALEAMEEASQAAEVETLVQAATEEVTPALEVMEEANQAA